jgi:hypothetical protein
MAKPTKARLGKGGGPPDPVNFDAFSDWLTKQPREWSVTIAARAALRLLPLAGEFENPAAFILSTFRATAIARFAAKYPNRASAASSSAAAASKAAYPGSAGSAGFAASAAAAAARFAAASARFAAAAANAASNEAAASVAIKNDAQRLYRKELTAEQLARDPLWSALPPPRIGGIWQGVVQQLRAQARHWQVWIDWYEDVVAGAPRAVIGEAHDAAFTDIPGELPWVDGPDAVNTEIANRLAELARNAQSSEIPDQSPAPVRVEERDGKVSKATDSDGALSASERDFRAWRDPVIDHIDELTASDFAVGTNHSRIRDRLTSLGKLLPGEIANVKERQFRIGYEIERFEGLMAAYRSGDEDMPMLNAVQLEDLDRLRVALKMGIDKLERWSEFRKQANESVAGEGDADRKTVGDALDEMAAAMEQHPKYFDPELPATFRFLSEAVRDPRGATRTIVYGAIKSAENVVSFLGQRALGIGKKGAEGVETHISKAVATSLIAGLSGAALGLSGALSQGWAWLKPLLAALVAGG